MCCCLLPRPYITKKALPAREGGASTVFSSSHCDLIIYIYVVVLILFQSIRDKRNG